MGMEELIIEEWKTNARKKGRIEGREEGREEGKSLGSQKKARQTIIKLHELGFDVPTMAEIVSESPEFVNQVVAEISKK